MLPQNVKREKFSAKPKYHAAETGLQLVSDYQIPNRFCGDDAQKLDFSTSNDAKDRCSFGAPVMKEVAVTSNMSKHVATIGISIVGWYAFSLCLTGANKYLFDTLGFNYPLLVTFSHFLLISLLLHLAFSVLGKCSMPARPEITIAELLKYLLPVGALSATEIALSNYSYTLVSLSAMTVIKSSIVVVVYLLSIAFKLEPFSKKLLGVVVFIVWSIALTVPNLEIKSVLGVVLLCIAVACAALRWVIVHLQFSHFSYSPLQYMLLTQPVSAICLALPAFVLDVRRLIDSQIALPDPAMVVAAMGIISLSVGLAFLVVFAEYRLVHSTSSLSFTVAGVGKEITTVLMSVILFKEHVSFTAALGIIGSILGIVTYTRVKQQLPSHPISSANVPSDDIRSPYSAISRTSPVGTSPRIVRRAESGMSSAMSGSPVAKKRMLSFEALSSAATTEPAEDLQQRDDSSGAWVVELDVPTESTYWKQLINADLQGYSLGDLSQSTVDSVCPA